MKTYIFYKKNKIERFNKKFKEISYYSIINKEKCFFFWTKYKVIFFNNNDINQIIFEKLDDILIDEFQIEIKSKEININSLQNILLTINTSNNGLLIGKFKQNKLALEKYLSRVISRIFLLKINITVKFLIETFNKFNWKKRNNKKRFQTKKNDQ